jgi:hypothetical protein
MDLPVELRQRAPLLIVGADKDHTVPASVSRAQYKKYERCKSAPLQGRGSSSRSRRYRLATLRRGAPSSNA